MVEPRHLDRRGKIVVITGFLDESGTHGAASQNTAMAGFVGDEAQWMHLEAGWKKVLVDHPEIDPIHGKDLLPRRGVYSDWNDEKYEALINDLGSLIYDSGIYGMLCVLHNTDYQEFRNQWKGSRYSPDSAYGLCFRACLGGITEAISRDAPGNRLSIIIEDGHKNRHEAEEIFNSIKHRRIGPHWEMLGNFAFAAKRDYGAIQAADLYAYGAHRHIERDLEGKDNAGTAKSYQALVGRISGTFSYLSKEALIPIANTLKAAYDYHQEASKKKKIIRTDQDE
jgi:hypothetical protein